jgi:hypothetical protein
MKRDNQGTAVMKSANSAATRTGSWSVAKREFAQRVTASGSFKQMTATPAAESTSHVASPSGKHKK